MITAGLILSLLARATPGARTSARNGIAEFIPHPLSFGERTGLKPGVLLRTEVGAPFSGPNIPAKLPQETKAQFEARMRWWENARFGMFIHWGLYSIPAGKWGNNTGYAEWIREEAHIPVHEYEKFQGQFNPVKFNAKAWARMAKDAGMRYVVITTKHHDGFNMFFSHYTDWSIEHTPFHRDVARELANAVRGEGMQMGWYHSIMDWHHPDYLPRRTWEVADRPVDGANFDRFVTYLRNDVTQLLTEYGPIGVMWFDGEWEKTWNAKYGDALYDLCRELQPKVIVNNRVSVGRGGIEDAKKQAGDYGTPEQTIPATGLGDQPWETCMTMNGHWGFNAYDTDWKSTKTLVRNLVDIASKGGNYLLNIGPRSDGTFPPQAVERLHEIGQWMHVNGESIYGTTASVFAKLPWGRSTTKRHGGRTTLYLQVLDWPKDGRLVVPDLGNRPLSARILGEAGRCVTERKDTDLVIHVPATAPNPVATVVALDIAGAPIVYGPPVIDAPSDLIVGSTKVALEPPSSHLPTHYTLDGTTPTFASPTYREPFLLTHGATVRAASFLGSRRVSQVVGRSFLPVEPWPAVAGAPSEPGLTREVFRGAWDKVPDFDTLIAESSRSASELDVPMVGGKPVENIGLRYSGCFKVARAGVYDFALTSDDGSRLWVDGNIVVDNDGTHSAATKSNQIPLAAGAHKITIGWFNQTGGAALSLRVGIAGGELFPLAKFDLTH